MANVVPSDSLHQSAFRPSFFVRLQRRVQRLIEIDPFASMPGVSEPIALIGFGVLCTVAGILLRSAIDLIWPGAAPFGLILPVVLVATLFGRWQAGVTCLLLSSLYAWYFVIPVKGSLSFETPSDGPGVFVNITAGAFVVLLAELFRRTVRQALSDREVLFREIEHRVRNNFASVASMLRHQIRQNSQDKTVFAALHSALGRVESYAIVNSFLYRGENYTGLVDMRAYIEQLCDSLRGTMTQLKPITIRHQLEPITLQRDQAIVVGLLVNEVVANALKHAFANRERGDVLVRFVSQDGVPILSISDDGRGLSGERSNTSLGFTLIAALAEQANAKLAIETASNGTTVTFTFGG